MPEESEVDKVLGRVGEHVTREAIDCIDHPVRFFGRLGRRPACLRQSYQSAPRWSLAGSRSTPNGIRFFPEWERSCVIGATADILKPRSNRDIKMPKKMSPEGEVIAAYGAAVVAAFQVLINCLEERDALQPGSLQTRSASIWK
jgi:hypothetical protein